MSSRTPPSPTIKSCWPIFFSIAACSLCSSSPRGPSTSPSAHSISTPEKNRFPRGTTSRSTFHGAQLRDRRSATYNGPPASPTLSHDTGALAQQRRGTSTGIISKITSKFVRRSVERNEQSAPSWLGILHPLMVKGWVTHLNTVQRLSQTLSADMLC